MTDEKLSTYLETTPALDLLDEYCILYRKGINSSVDETQLYMAIRQYLQLAIENFR